MAKTRKQDNLQWPKQGNRQSTTAKMRKQTIYNDQNEETDNLQWPKRGNRQSTTAKTRKQTIYNGQNKDKKW